MRDANVLGLLLYCHKCYITESDQKYIGECMHVLCVSCFKPNSPCCVCSSTSSFIVLDPEFSQKILKNPSESFQEPLDSLMFQLSSAMNLILHQKNEISKLKKFAKRAKDEIVKMRMIFKKERAKNKQPGLFTFQKEKAAGKSVIRNEIDRIYHQEPKKADKYLKPSVSIKNHAKDSLMAKNRSNGVSTGFNGNRSNVSLSARTRNSYLMDIAHKNRNKQFSEFNPGDRSISSSNNTRVTLPQKKPETTIIPYMPNICRKTGRTKLTKVICTLGPSSSSADTIEDMAKNGMDIARINMSHSDPDHQNISKTFIEIKKAQKTLDFSVALDTKGREIRIIDIKSDSLSIEKDDFVIFYISSADSLKTSTYSLNEDFSEFHAEKLHFIEIDYDLFQHSDDLNEGFVFKVDDNALELEFVKFSKQSCVTQSLNAHVLKNNKSICLPGLQLKIPIDNERDKRDILFGLQNNIDMIFLSHVDTASDVVKMRDYVTDQTKNMPLIVSKIESKLGFINLIEIIAVSDGIMVARGDLSSEFNICEIHLLQKCITKQCRIYKKPCIIATQMLESMVNNILPTRAEVTDVTTAVLDANDCVMLSAETASGKYPVQCVKVITRICQETEHSPLFECFETDDEYKDVQEKGTTPYDLYNPEGVSDHRYDFFYPVLSKKDLIEFYTNKHKILLLGITNDLKVFKMSKLYRGAYLAFLEKNYNLKTKESIDFFNECAKRYPHLEYEDLLFMEKKTDENLDGSEDLEQNQKHLSE